MGAVSAAEVSLRIVVVVVAVAVFADSLLRARTLQVSPAEERVFRLFNDRPDAVHIPVWAVMQAGSLAAVFVVTAILWEADEHPRTAVTFVAGFVVWAGVKRAKRFVGRGRPGALCGAPQRWKCGRAAGCATSPRPVPPACWRHGLRSAGRVRDRP